MRLCRFEAGGRVQIGFYTEGGIVPIDAPEADLLACLPGGSREAETRAEYERLERAPDSRRPLLPGQFRPLTPIARPNKLLLLAGNYAEHVLERGGSVAARGETFPYVFMKPPSTTLIADGEPIVLPASAQQGVDWECELGVVIGRRLKDIPEGDALSAVAGYTVINDISQRQFKPNPGRKKRERDAFFDWQHGKWFDSFCPCGPCVRSAADVPDPQALSIQLRVNGELKQDGSTAQMIFPVAAVIAFISSFVTLEPGDIIATGTPKGVGSATGTYLKPGDTVEAAVGSVGTLRNPVSAGGN